MKPEERLLIQLLSDYAAGRASSFDPQCYDLHRLVSIAKEQCVSGIIYSQCRQRLADRSEMLDILRACFADEVFYSVCFREDYAEVSKALADAGVEFAPFKGFEIGQYHPIPELRSKSDIDLVIRPQDRNAADAVMRSLGFSRYIDSEAVWVYSRDVVSYELHTHMFYGELMNGADCKGYFDGIWEHITDGHIDPSYQLLYFVAHTARHVQECGNGFRAFLDIVFLCKNAPIDAELVLRELKTLGLYDFACVCSALCRHWFGAELPIPAAELESDFVSEATEKVFADGIFGLDNEENRIAGETKETGKRKLPYFLSVVILTIQRLFPPYRIMRYTPQYSFVSGRPWLLPAAWLYRFYYCLRYKRDVTRRRLTDPSREKGNILRRREFLSKWGL